MSAGIAEKIIKEHLVKGKYSPGREIGITIDQTLTQDATGTFVCLQFETFGMAKVQTGLSVSYVDHNTIQDGFENADDHKYLQSVAAKYGLYFSRAGNGICHQVHLERFAAPGKTLLGSDSHTPTGGGLGMLAIGAGGIDVALAMAGAPFYLECPKIIRVDLRGALRPWSSAKDIILEVLRRLTTKGNTGALIEYGGDGVASLSVQERATITNMGAELGVTTSVFPSDAVTRAFLKAQGREECWREILPDAGAQYDHAIELDLASIHPLAAKPDSPDNVVPVAEIAGIKVDQVAIGSCTNASCQDLMKVAAVLKGRKAHPDVSLVIAPASRQTFSLLAKNGALEIFLSAGARILEPVCGFCIGNCHAPRTEGVSLRTTNRNFRGRSGTKSAKVYLVSPETAAVSAVLGVIADPAAAGFECPPRAAPEIFPIDDSMISAPLPEAGRAAVEILRGPNIGRPLALEPLADAITGKIELKTGDKVTTDDIMPAGARLKYRSNIEKYAQFVFEHVDAGFSRRCLENKKKNIDSVIIGGLSYGQGSSREHAAVCPRYLGVKAVIARSFERIHLANLVNYGIVPLVFAVPEDYERFNQSDEIEINGLRNAVKDGGKIQVLNRTKNLKIEASLLLSARQREILLAGGALNHAGKK
ncbi:MAG: aconitate hydratase [Kiritimatiellae bacterium]|nr:aconitate hydratase [Kiritimatiellia bacterium]